MATTKQGGDLDQVDKRGLREVERKRTYNSKGDEECRQRSWARMYASPLCDAGLDVIPLEVSMSVSFSLCRGTPEWGEGEGTRRGCKMRVEFKAFPVCFCG